MPDTSPTPVDPIGPIEGIDFDALRRCLGLRGDTEREDYLAHACLILIAELRSARAAIGPDSSQPQDEQIIVAAVEECLPRWQKDADAGQIGQEWPDALRRISGGFKTGRVHLSAIGPDSERIRELEAENERLTRALHDALVTLHPVYANTTGPRGGIGGSTVTPYCAVNNPYDDAQRQTLEAVEGVLGDAMRRVNP